jgi:hypothetical protein
MKRIFLGLLILLVQFIDNLPWDSLRRALGMPYWDNELASLIPIVAAIIITIVFLRTTRLRERLDMPAPGLMLITVGIVLNIGVWITIIGVVIAIMSIITPEQIFIGLVALGVFATKFGALIQACVVFANILLLIGFYRLFIHLEPDETTALRHIHD